MLCFIYFWILKLYSTGWANTPMAEEVPMPEGPITVIVAARNEAPRIVRCIESLLAQDIPRHWLQIIIVNDHSTDRTLKEMRSIKDERLLSLSLPKELTGKKQAIEHAMQHATGDVIVTTDADCIHHPQWLQKMVGSLQHLEKDMILGPMIYKSGSGFLYQLQQLELATLMCMTAGSLRVLFPLMANGANLAYKKELFDELKGYDNARQNPSGDDTALLFKAVKAKKDIGFAMHRYAMAATMPAIDMDSFWQQRLRWASKSAGIGHKKVSMMMGFLYLVNLLLVGLTIAAFITPGLWLYLFFAWGVKTLGDGFTMAPVLLFQGRLSTLPWLLIAEPFYTLFMVVAGPMSLIKPISWKGRTYRLR